MQDRPARPQRVMMIVVRAYEGADRMGDRLRHKVQLSPVAWA